jgi:serpin B
MAYAASGRSALGCSPAPTDPAELIAGNTAFGLDLYGQLRKAPGNLFLSPFSISTALAMTSAGAKGTTLDEMNKVLHLPADPHQAFGDLLGRITGAGKDIKRPYELTIANAIWAQKDYPWRPEFKALVNMKYLAGLMEADFKAMPEAARQQINDWVEKETREKIKELIPANVITPLTRMVLTNAVYFKGPWAAPFRKEATKDQPFQLSDGTKADVPMMTQTGTFGYGEVTHSFKTRSGERAKLLELPYAGKDQSMVVIVPDRRFAFLEEELSAAALAEWMKAIRPQRVQVFLPRFKVEMAQPLSLVEPLQALGMKAAFDDRKADFSGMHTGGEKVCITAILHKAFVDVTEAGTEAAAATGAVIGLRSAPAGEPKVFRADRPFLFLIRDTKTGSVLFLGRYTNPKA